MVVCERIQLFLNLVIQGNSCNIRQVSFYMPCPLINGMFVIKVNAMYCSHGVMKINLSVGITNT